MFHRHDATAKCASGQEVNIEKITYRESRDSEANPLSTPILVGFDVTGSMGAIPEEMVKNGLGSFVGQLLERKPITDPHILFMGIGDAHCDRQPLQATQFEADNRICDQLTDIFLEGGGGGNDFESYDLAWAFSAYRTKTDAWEKRKSKGFLFTIGDEEFPKSTSETYLHKIFANDCPQAPTPENLLAAAQDRYSVFHVIIAQGSYASRRLSQVESGWQQRLRGRALTLSDYRLLPELIISAIAIQAGQQLEDVLAWWKPNTAGVVRAAFRL